MTKREASPTVNLEPGDYIVNAAFGRADITRKITVAPGATIEREVRAQRRRPSRQGPRRRRRAAGQHRQPTTSTPASATSPTTASRFSAAPSPTSSSPQCRHLSHRLAATATPTPRSRPTSPSRRASSRKRRVALRSARDLQARRPAPAARRCPIRSGRCRRRMGEVVKQSVGALPTHILAPGTYYGHRQVGRPRLQARLHAGQRRGGPGRGPDAVSAARLAPALAQKSVSTQSVGQPLRSMRPSTASWSLTLLQLDETARARSASARTPWRDRRQPARCRPAPAAPCACVVLRGRAPRQPRMHLRRSSSAAAVSPLIEAAPRQRQVEPGQPVAAGPRPPPRSRPRVSAVASSARRRRGARRSPVAAATSFAARAVGDGSASNRMRAMPRPASAATMTRRGRHAARASPSSCGPARVQVRIIAACVGASPEGHRIHQAALGPQSC